mmetsp:Transcript_25664/g.61863  ORF Transcript_25664/g.61863 Transcript_25664/m.61863 type:complete len:291 (+) Transcript_25664:1513-2385(+)
MSEHVIKQLRVLDVGIPAEAPVRRNPLHVGRRPQPRPLARRDAALNHRRRGWGKRQVVGPQAWVDCDSANSAGAGQPITPRILGHPEKVGRQGKRVGRLENVGSEVAQRVDERPGLKVGEHLHLLRDLGRVGAHAGLVKVAPVLAVVEQHRHRRGTGAKLLVLDVKDGVEGRVRGNKEAKGEVLIELGGAVCAEAEDAKEDDNDNDLDRCLDEHGRVIVLQNTPQVPPILLARQTAARYAAPLLLHLLLVHKAEVAAPTLLRAAAPAAEAVPGGDRNALLVPHARAHKKR